MLNTSVCAKKTGEGNKGKPSSGGSWTMLSWPQNTPPDTQEEGGGVWDKIQIGLDGLSIALDATGVGGVVSPIPDALNAVIDLAQGDLKGAGLSAIAAIPFAGSTANIARLTKEAALKYPAKAVKEELHHIVPKYLGGAVDGAMVKLNAAYHQVITNAFREAWPYGGAKPTEKELEKLLADVYSKVPIE